MRTASTSPGPAAAAAGRRSRTAGRLFMRLASTAASAATARSDQSETWPGMSRATSELSPWSETAFTTRPRASTKARKGTSRARPRSRAGPAAGQGRHGQGDGAGERGEGRGDVQERR